jgi:hypothetical protein
MNKAATAILCLLFALAACPEAVSQYHAQMPADLGLTETAAPASGSPCGGPRGLTWARDCFPRCGCPDDYCPNPFPRPCWPPYPPFYQCVPAGDCGQGCGCGQGKDRLSWWFLATPRALREAVWCQP